MTLDNEVIAAARTWRRDFHRYPELLFDVDRTAARVADLIRSFGCDEVATASVKAGFAVIRGGNAPESRTIGIRADIDGAANP